MATVKVLVPGVYVDLNFRALPQAQAGDTIVVADGWYVESLVADGFVVPAEEQMAATDTLVVVATATDAVPESAPTVSIVEEKPPTRSQEKSRVRRGG